MMGLKIRTFCKALVLYRTSWRHLYIVEAVKSARKMRLCMQRDCTTGCIAIFRKLVKEAVTGKEFAFTDLAALAPESRVELKKFCEAHSDFLSLDERILLIDFYSDLDPKIPAEAAELEWRSAQESARAARRLEAWKCLVAERRAQKKQIKAEAHARRLEEKKKRDQEYWRSYWKAKNAKLNEE